MIGACMTGAACLTTGACITGAACLTTGAATEVVTGAEIAGAAKVVAGAANVVVGAANVVAGAAKVVAGPARMVAVPNPPNPPIIFPVLKLWESQPNKAAIRCEQW